MKDFLGNEIVLGDNVVYLFYGKTSSDFRKGKVVKITEKMVLIETKLWYQKTTYKQPDKIIDISALERKAKNELQQ